MNLVSSPDLCQDEAIGISKEINLKILKQPKEHRAALSAEPQQTALFARGKSTWHFVRSGKALREPPKYAVLELQAFVDFLKAPERPLHLHG